MADEQRVKTLRAEVEKNLAVFEKALIKRADWGTITFDKAEADLKRAKDVLTYLKDLPVEVLPDGVMNSAISQTTALTPVLSQIDAFTITSGEAPVPRRDALVSQLHNQVDALYNAVSVWIPFLAYQKGDIAENVGRLSKAVDEAKALLGSAHKSAEEKRKEIDDIVSAARTASASAGAAVFTDDFHKESSAQEKAAGNWLIAAGVIGAMSVLAASAMWFFAYTSSATLSTVQLVQIVAAKLVILSILIGAATWCGGIYKALRHLTSVNRHRALSLRTLQAFAKAASDDQTKNAVLMEACRAVFVGGVTGYLDGKDGTDDSGLKVIEIAKTLSGKGMN